MRLFLFTESFPFGMSETFLESELPFLSEKFDNIILIPLYKKEGIRDLPSNVKCWDPIISFSPKNKWKMIVNGIFNFSPIEFALKEFVEKKVYSNIKWIWNFFTSLLLYRSIFSNKKIWENIENEIIADDKLYFYWADKSALIIPFLKKRIGNITFVRFHRTDLYEYAKNDYIPFRAKVFPCIDWFIPISDDGKKYLKEQYKNMIPKDKIYVGRLGVFDNGMNPVQLIGKPFHLLSCSYMVSVKRIHLIIEALSQLNIDIKWTHIGNGILFDDIKCRAAFFPPNIHVELLGSLSNQEVIRYYQNNHVDLFINVSASEGIPVSIMEALSFGIPVIATNVGGTSEIVDKEVGMLLNMDIEVGDLSKTIRSFAEKDLSMLRLNSRNRWDERCNAQKNYSDFVDFIDKN